MRHTAKLLILFGLPLAVVIWFTDNTLAIILTPFLVFLLHMTYITRGKFFILDTAYAFWISIKLQFYFGPQLDWIRANIGKIYLTEEVLEYIWIMYVFKSKQRNVGHKLYLNDKLMSAIVHSILIIPKDVKINLIELISQKSRKFDYLADVALRESYESKHEAKELKELMAAIHKNPHRYKIICEYDFK